MSFPRYPEYKDSGVEWLGAVPVHWSVRSIKRLSPVLRGASPRPIDDPKFFDDHGEYSWVRIADVSASDGELLETPQKMSDLGSSLSVKLQPGSLFVSIAGSVGKPCITRINACIHDGFVYFPHLSISPNFLYRVFEEGSCFSGLGKWGTQLNLNTDTIGSIQVALPPAEELPLLLAFLDRETAKIDALVAEQETLIALLKEKRQAVISHAVTKGLNPDAPMKPSGIEWLGDVPAHWVTRRLRDLCTSISTGPFGTALGSDDYVEDGIPVINPSHIDDGRCVPDTQVTVSPEVAERLSFWKLQVGDVITARRGELGRAAVITNIEQGWICGTGSLRITPNTADASPAFIYWVLQGGHCRTWLDMQSVGSTMPNLSEAVIARMPLAMPPTIEEQTELIAKLQGILMTLNHSAQEAQRAIILLKERRSALISAAVTGQIDVRGLVPAEAA